MNLTTGSILSFTPDPDRYEVVGTCDGETYAWPVIGWAVEVRLGAALAPREFGDSDGEAETDLSPVVIDDDGYAVTPRGLADNRSGRWTFEVRRVSA